MSELISRQKLIEELEKKYHDIAKEDDERWVWWNRAIYTAVHIIKDQPPADQWIPVTYHEATEEEREVYGMNCPYILDCPLPEEGDEILVCSKNGKVFEDLMCYDDGWYLDGGYDFVEEIVAWMPLPEPYKGVE